MLTQGTLAKLAALTYRTDAKRRVCWLPLAGIFWDDEMPDVGELLHFPNEDRIEIYRLFGIRVRLWRNESFSDDEKQFWNAIRSQVPGWAFWQRLAISAEDQRGQEDAERDTAEGLEALFADADKVTITEKDGVQSFSATFDLTKDRMDVQPRQSFWKRILRR